MLGHPIHTISLGDGTTEQLNKSSIIDKKSGFTGGRVQKDTRHQNAVVSWPEEYLKQLQAEAKGVEERITELKKES
ncbi:hypothetical protein ACFLTO_04295 [Chloroflexota bacterium]